MTLVILWMLLGLLCGCLIGNAANRNLCYQIVKIMLTNNLKYAIILSMGEQFSLCIFINEIRLDLDLWILKGAMLFVMAYLAHTG